MPHNELRLTCIMTVHFRDSSNTCPIWGCGNSQRWRIVFVPIKDVSNPPGAANCCKCQSIMKLGRAQKCSAVCRRIAFCHKLVCDKSRWRGMGELAKNFLAIRSNCLQCHIAIRSWPCKTFLIKAIEIKSSLRRMPLTLSALIPPGPCTRTPFTPR